MLPAVWLGRKVLNEIETLARAPPTVPAGLGECGHPTDRLGRCGANLRSRYGFNREALLKIFRALLEARELSFEEEPALEEADTLEPARLLKYVRVQRVPESAVMLGVGIESLILPGSNRMTSPLVWNLPQATTPRARGAPAAAKLVQKSIICAANS
jgi:hypothetical protein